MKPGTAIVAHLSPGEWSACFGASLIDLLFYDVAHNKRIVSHQFGHMHKEAGADNIYAARNKCCQVMLDETQAEWLWFVDSDMGFAPDTVDALVRSADPASRPVVGGLAFALKSDGVGPMFARRYRAQPTIYLMAEVDDEVGFTPMFDYPPDSVFPVDGTGAACLLIHRPTNLPMYQSTHHRKVIHATRDHSSWPLWRSAGSVFRGTDASTVRRALFGAAALPCGVSSGWLRVRANR